MNYERRSPEKPVLVILAAGLGRRYGGLKPLAPIGARGEAIIDLSVRDAMEAGFESVLMVVRAEIEATLEYHVKRCWPADLHVELVRQDSPAGAPTAGASGPAVASSAPRGTAQAVLATRAAVSAPFGVVNADDLYGAASYQLLYDHLSAAGSDKVATSSSSGRGANSGAGTFGGQEAPSHALVGFRLRSTIVGQGPVKRATCEQSPEGYLTAITEQTITARGDGTFLASNDRATVELTGDELVSVNMWGFLPSIFPVLQEAFDQFLEDQGDQGANDTNELLLPDVVGAMVSKPDAERVRILASTGRCIGVTHGADLAAVREQVEDLVAKGIIPDPLWAGARRAWAAP